MVIIAHVVCLIVQVDRGNLTYSWTLSCLVPPSAGEPLIRVELLPTRDVIFISPFMLPINICTLLVGLVADPHSEAQLLQSYDERKR